MFRLIYISYFTLHYFIDIIVVICSVKVYSVLSLKVYIVLHNNNPCNITVNDIISLTVIIQ